VTNIVDYDMDVQAAVDFPRLHHQWLPDEIKLERYRERSKLVNDLERFGHKVVAPASPRSQGDAHTIWIDTDGTRHGAADRRLMARRRGIEGRLLPLSKGR